MPVVWLGLGGTLLDLLNGGQRHAWLLCGCRPGEQTHAVAVPLPSRSLVLPRQYCLLPFGSSRPSCKTPAGYDKCKVQREALESYMRAREAFGEQATSLDHQRQQRQQEGAD